MTEPDLQNQAEKSVELANELFLPEVRRLIEEGHTVTIRVKGFSMRPFLESLRDKVILCAPRNLKVGDAALAEVSKGCFVLHRVIKIEGSHITLMGDGNIRGTENCERQDVVGVVQSFIRNGKNISRNNFRWKVYSYIWPKFLPIRSYLLYIYRALM